MTENRAKSNTCTRSCKTKTQITPVKRIWDVLNLSHMFKNLIIPMFIRTHIRGGLYLKSFIISQYSCLGSIENIWTTITQKGSCRHFKLMDNWSNLLL